MATKSLHDIHRRYDGPVPTRRDTAQVGRSVEADLRRLRDSTVQALTRADVPSDVQRLRELLMWYDRQIERVEGVGR